MEFDFSQLYRSYSNVELLVVVRNREQYQKEAVQTAEELLQHRTVTNEEREAAGYIIGRPAETNAVYPLMIDSATDKDFLNSFEQESDFEKDSPRFKALFTLIIIFYMRSIYYAVQNLYASFRYDIYEFNVAGISAIAFLYVTIMLITFYRRKKLGWYAMLIENLASFLWILYFALENFQYLTFINFSGFSVYLLPIFIKPLIISFLLQSSTTERFQITKEKRSKAIMIFLIITLVLAAILYVIKNGESI